MTAKRTGGSGRRREDIKRRKSEEDDDGMMSEKGNGWENGRKRRDPMPAGFSGVFVRFRKRGGPSFWPNDRQTMALGKSKSGLQNSQTHTKQSHSCVRWTVKEEGRSKKKLNAVAGIGMMDRPSAGIECDITN